MDAKVQKMPCLQCSPLQSHPSHGGRLSIRFKKEFIFKEFISFAQNEKCDRNARCVHNAFMYTCELSPIHRVLKMLVKLQSLSPDLINKKSVASKSLIKSFRISTFTEATSTKV